jgi:hypothetical protein
MTINDVGNWDLILDMPHSQSPIFQPQPECYTQAEQLEQSASPGKWKRQSEGQPNIAFASSHFPSPQHMMPVLEPNKFDEGSYQNFFSDGDGGLVPVPSSQTLMQPSTFSSQVNDSQHYTGIHTGLNNPISYRRPSMNQDIEPQTPPFTPISTQSRPVKRTVQPSFTNSTRNKLQTVSPGPRSSIQYSQSKNGHTMSPISRENFTEVMVYSKTHQNDSPEARLHGNTPLFQAVVLGNMKIVAILVERSNNINAENMSGQTVLHIAVQEGHTNIVAYLIRCGSNLNHRDNDGNTPLHVAVMNGHESIVQILLDAGANMEISNFEGDVIIMKDKTR